MSIAWKVFGAFALAGALVTGLAAEEGGGSNGSTRPGRPGVRPGRPGRPTRPNHRPRIKPRSWHVFGFHGFGLTEKENELARLNVWSVPDVWAKGGATGSGTGWAQGDPGNPECNAGSPGYPECVGMPPGGGGVTPEPGTVSSDDTTSAAAEPGVVGGAEPAIAPTPMPPEDEPIQKKGRVLIGVLRLGASHYLVGDFQLKTEAGGTKPDGQERRRPRILGFEATLYSRPPQVVPMMGRPDGTKPPVEAPRKVGTLALAREQKAIGRGDPTEIVAGKAQIEKVAWRLVGHGRGPWGHRIIPAPPPGIETPPGGGDDVMPMPAEVPPTEVPPSSGDGSDTSVNDGF